MAWLWLLLIALPAVLFVFWLIGRMAGPTRRVERAGGLFRSRRVELEKQFFEAASTSGKPRGLRWLECQWDDTVLFARNTKTEHIYALVGVTIRFEAVEGGDMEGLPAVGNLRNATGVFVFDQGRWHTAGRAVFNLNPDEAIQHFGLVTT